MRHDPELVAETCAWLLRAHQDPASGRVVLTVEPPLAADAAFHAQQAAGKTMEGFLTWHSQVFRRTHNLTELGEVCARLDPNLDPLLRRAAGLTEYAWRFRYPGQPEEPSEAEARDALATAEAVYETILARLPVEVRP
jgi:HEPN domain-containing protein